jgi:NAD dependent epimerase/dehydratase|tara:strand:+ start:4570 stop:5565 length:996 start_codon:yes stop_codon:yes gene_type:complete
MQKRILITGSEGFIGSHVVELMLSKGYSVNAFINYNFLNNRGHLQKIKKNKRIKYFFGDIRDEKTVDTSMKNCDVVLNLAALIGIPYSYDAPSSYISTNINGTLNLLNYSLKHKIKRFIHTSTSEVYGSAQFVPITEKHPLVGQSPYSASKIGADQLVTSFNKSFDLNTIILRPFNTFGPRQSLRAVIPTIIAQAINGKKIKIGNLSTRRDFTFVDDTAIAFYKAIICNSRAFGQTFNLGTGYDVSIKDIIMMVEKILNKKLIIELDKKRIRPSKSEVLRLLSDNTLAKKILKWSPQYSKKKGFEKGLIKTIEYIKKDILNYKQDNKDYIK